MTNISLAHFSAFSINLNEMCSNFVMLLVGFFETFAAGWIFGLEKQLEEFGALAVYSYFASNFGSVIIACGLWFGLEDVSTGAYLTQIFDTVVEFYFSYVLLFYIQ